MAGHRRDPAGEEAGCGGPGLAWLHVVCGCRLVGCTAKLSKTKLVGYGGEINILNCQAKLSIPAVSMTIARSLNLRHLWCDKTTHFSGLSIVPNTRCTWVMIMLFNQLLDMPHLSGRLMDYLGKGEMLANGCKHIWERSAFCAYGTFLGSFMSAHETWDQHFTCFYYFFNQCRKNGQLRTQP